jgi:hypothetical protein
MSARVGVSVLALLALGCATFSHEPERLLAQGRTELGEKRFAQAYETFHEIRATYPHSPEAADAFPLAAQAFQGMYARTRFTADSRWSTTETRFMFEWLETYFGGDEFPQISFQRLVQGMPYEFFEQYEAFAASRPNLARWHLEVTKDNGLVDTIEAVRVDSKSDSAS